MLLSVINCTSKLYSRGGIPVAFSGEIYNSHIHFCKSGLINIYFILWVTKRYFYSICCPNAPSFGHCELFQVGSLFPLIFPHILSTFLFSDIIGCLMFILYYPFLSPGMNYIFKECWFHLLEKDISKLRTECYTGSVVNYLLHLNVP